MNTWAIWNVQISENKSLSPISGQNNRTSWHNRGISSPLTSLLAVVPIMLLLLSHGNVTSNDEAQTLTNHTDRAADGWARLTLVSLSHRLWVVRCCFLLPEVYCPLPDPALGRRPLHCSRELWVGGNCPPQVEVCTVPGCPCCWCCPSSHGGGCRWPFQPSWCLCSVSWPEVGRGVQYRPPGVDARLCGAQSSCSSKSGRSGGQRAPTTGCRQSGGQERLWAGPSRIHQWSNSHTCAHENVAPQSPPNQNWNDKKPKTRVKSYLQSRMMRNSRIGWHQAKEARITLEY